MNRVELFWLPLGAGETTGVVRASGRLYEALAATRERRPRRALYHSALRVVLDSQEHIIEMAPVWSSSEPGRGVAGQGAVGRPCLARWRLFRYEVRCWAGGVIPDAAYAVDSPVLLRTDPSRTRRLVEAVPDFPRATWGLDELGAGEMWNSNSLVSWLLVTSGHAIEDLTPPRSGRAPGWDAGRTVASRGAVL